MNTASPVLTELTSVVPSADLVLPERPTPKRTVRRALLVALWWTARLIGSVGERVFGFACLLVGLSILAALPVAQFFCLGYLLEAGARVARSGRFRDGVFGIGSAARVGGIILCSWLLLLPVRFNSWLALNAEIIEPQGHNAAIRRIVVMILTVLLLVHIVTACARGGKVRYFLWPFNAIWLVRRLWQDGAIAYYVRCRDAVWDFVVKLELWKYFSLGLRGFLGGLAWLALPATFLAIGGHPSGRGILVGWIGALMLLVVLFYLPFLQMRLAVENRFLAVFDVGAVRREFRRAPWAYSLALFITLLFAVPLYLFKIEVVPREAAWLPSLVFMIFIYPARLLTGWAVARASRREQPRHWVFRWMGWVFMPPAVLVYLGIVYLSQFFAWGGLASLYEQHAFLLPVPFIGL